MSSKTEFLLVEELTEKEASISTAESCTGGIVAARITSVPGASAVFKYGAVTYSNEAKAAAIGVSEKTLSEHGAVSSETAAEMAAGIRKVLGAEIGVSVTGLAGPAGDEGKPVGLVYIGVSSDNYSAVAENYFKGDRESIRNQASDVALEMAFIAAKKI